MQAVVVSGPGALRVETVPDPAPGPGHVVLKVAACGICGSDLHVHQLGALPAGTIYGHEFCGEVTESGEGFRAGDRVCALPVLSCGRCDRCRRGMGMYCETQAAIGLGAAPGAFAEYVAVASHEIVKLPDGIDDDHGALIEPLAVGLHAVKTARLRRGDRCVILGAGPIGLSVLLWARHFQAGDVIVSERSPARRALAEKFGASVVVDPARTPVAEIAHGSGAGGVSTVFEATGVAGLIDQAIACAGFRGHVVVVGVCIGPDAIQPAVAITKEARLSFVFAYEKDDFTETVTRLAGGEIVPGPMLGRRVGLAGVPEAFEQLSSEGGDAAGKILVVPGAAA